MLVSDDPSFGGVPRLAESLRRVWLECDLGRGPAAILAAGLEELRTDHQSGARQLAGKALEILRDVIVALDESETHDAWWAKVRGTAWHLWKNGRESMGAAILSVLLGALKSTEDTLRLHDEQPGAKESKQRRDAVVENLQKRITSRANVTTNPVSETLIKFLDDEFGERAKAASLSIMTLSESSTISSCLEDIVRRTDFAIDLRVLESRPLFEGVSLAAAFADNVLSGDSAKGKPDREDSPTRFKVTIFTDAAAAMAAQGIDIVLLGADRIASSGSVSNKTGSLPVVLSAKHVSPKVKTVVLGETEKIAPPGDEKEHIVENNDPAQLVRSWRSDFNSDRVQHAAATFSKALGHSGLGDASSVQLVVSNIFFEWVPHSLVDFYVTEFGLWTRKDILEHSQQLEVEQQRLFGDI